MMNSLLERMQVSKGLLEELKKYLESLSELTTSQANSFLEFSSALETQWSIAMQAERDAAQLEAAARADDIRLMRQDSARQRDAIESLGSRLRDTEAGNIGLMSQMQVRDPPVVRRRRRAENANLQIHSIRNSMVWALNW